MSQLNFYVPEKIEQAIRKEAKSRRQSISAYLSDLVKAHVGHDGWQKDFFTKVAGGWQGDFPTIEKLTTQEREPW